LGGGGLLAGACLAAHGLNPHIQVYGCEPARALDALLSLREGRILMPHPVDTMAEGLRTSLGDLTLSVFTGSSSRCVCRGGRRNYPCHEDSI
ncbi:MAG: hypothetical protein P8X46_04365, partial [Nitrospirales bacterium]